MTLRPLVVSFLLGACIVVPPAADSGVDPTGSTTGTGTTSPTITTNLDDCTKAGYAQATAGVSGADLWQALTAATAAQTCSSYSDATYFMFVRLDRVDSEVEGVYTGRKTPVGDQKPDATDMNTEHTWPQSLGADVLPAKCDLHHLFPADSNANSRRAAYPFGLVTGSVDWTEGGSSLGNDASGQTVFEPRDVHKGNVARAMLYFSARYNMPLSQAQIDLFKSWHMLDPVDTAELDRTWSIAAEQVLTNPLVVCPDLVELL